MALGVFANVLDFSDVAADEFNDWYDHEHNPERLRVPGFLNATRWIGIENSKVSAVLYDLESVDVLKSPAFAAIGGANGTPWTKRVTARTKRWLRYEGIQFAPGDARVPEGAEALRLIAVNVDEAHASEFRQWCNEHLAAIATVSGVLSARMYLGSSAKQGYVALYHLASRHMLESQVWSDFTAWGRRAALRDHLRVDALAYQRRS